MMFKPSPFLTAALALMWLAFGGVAQAQQREAFNRLVVVVDSSGSYASRQAEAIAKVNQLLTGVANSPRRHWEQSDQVVVIALDALPEVIWRGTAAKLAETDVSEWTQRFAGRGDFANCTNVEAALELATRELNAAPVPNSGFIYAFSDLMTEPPTANGSLSDCAARRATPAAGFDWATLRGALRSAPESADIPHFVVFWMPPEQKRAWDQALVAQGFPASAYRLLSDSESATAQLDVPAAAVLVPSPEEQRRDRENLFGAVGSVIQVAVIVIVAVVGLAVLINVLRRRRPPPGRGRRVRRRPPAPNPQRQQPPQRQHQRSRR